jgi:hypothetical protein
MKRYSIMVKEVGSGREIELCQVDNNAKAIAKAASTKTLRMGSGNRTYLVFKYDSVRVVDNKAGGAR